MPNKHIVGTVAEVIMLYAQIHREKLLILLSSPVAFSLTFWPKNSPLSNLIFLCYTSAVSICSFIVSLEKCLKFVFTVSNAGFRVMGQPVNAVF